MKYVLAMGFLLLVSPLMAQEQEGEETLFGPDGKIENGGFGAPVVKVSKLNGTVGVLAGARAGWILDHVFSLGVGGYYLVSNIHADVPGPRNDPYLNLYYGGLDMEIVLASSAPVHLSVSSLVGAGAVGTRSALFADRNRYSPDMMGYGYYDGDYSGYHHHHGWDGGGWGDNWGWGAAQSVASPAPAPAVTTPVGSNRMDGFFVVEPAVNLDFNMTHSFRLSLGGSYRWVKGVNSTASTNKELTGPSAMITFRFGSF